MYIAGLAAYLFIVTSVAAPVNGVKYKEVLLPVTLLPPPGSESNV